MKHLYWSLLIVIALFIFFSIVLVAIEMTKQENAIKDFLVNSNDSIQVELGWATKKQLETIVLAAAKKKIIIGKKEDGKIILIKPKEKPQ